MNKVEMKKLLDQRLSGILKNSIHSKSNLKALKKSVKLQSKIFPNSNGEIYIDFLGDAKEYCLGMSFMSGEFDSFIENLSIPYRSNRPSGSGSHFALITYSENRGIFSRSSGTIRLPTTEDELEATVAHISRAINESYIIMADRFLHFAPELIDDIISNPNFYSYPYLLILFTAKINGIGLDTIMNPRITNKRLLGNASFDKKIATDLLG